jgi:lipoprotein-releasing system permease protein
MWEVVTSTGSAVALTFIVALALGIGALTLFFFGSSVVVLQGFARAARRPLPVLAMVLLWSAALGLWVAGSEDLRELLPGEFTPLVVWASASLAGLLVTGVLVAVCAWLLRAVSPASLARASLAVLGLGYAAIVGGSGRLGYALAPAAATLAVAGGVRWLRRGRPVGEVERGLQLLGVVLLLGAGVAAAGGGDGVAGAGAGLLQVFLALVLFGLLPLAAAGFLGMRHGAEWFIARRYLVARRRQTFISIISAICVGGVAAGVWLIITVLSVMNGFQNVWREEFVGKRAHLTVQSRYGTFSEYDRALASVLEEPEVIGAAPYLDAEGMVRGDAGQIVGVRVRGVDPGLVRDVTSFEVVAGSLEELNGHSDPPGIAIGTQLAFSLGVGVGDPLLLVSPFGGPPTPFGPAPRLHQYRVAAIYQSDFLQFDELLAYVSLASAQDFLRTEDVVDGIEVRVRDFYRSRRVADALQLRLGDPFYARDWKEFFPAFWQALKTEQAMMFVLLTMIMVVAAFVIVATLIMMIMEKTADIAILKAMGAEDATIERIFAIEGTLIGLAGVIVGVVAGILVTQRLGWVQQQVESLTGVDVLPASVYQGVSTVPASVDPVEVAAVAAIAMVLSLGATLLPSRQGASLDPAEALRYE